MNVYEVLMKSSSYVQTQVIHEGNILFQGEVREFWKSPIHEELETRHVWLVYVNEPWLRIVVSSDLRPALKKLFTYALFILLGLLFGWSMQGVWF